VTNKLQITSFASGHRLTMKTLLSRNTIFASITLRHFGQMLRVNSQKT